MNVRFTVTSLVRAAGLFGVLMAFGIRANAATYYVEQVAGSDSNAGTSTGAPWKNCPGMQGSSAYTGGQSLAAGDTVYLNNADTWQVSAASTGGFVLVGGVTYIGDSYGTGTRARIQASDVCDAGVIRFFDHPTIATVFSGIEVDANGTVSDGIDINHRYYSLMNGATKRVLNCEVHNTWSRQVNNQYKYGIIISNHGGSTGYAENVELIGCKVHDTSRDGICLYPGDESADCRIKNITVQGCESYNTGQDPDYSAGAGLLVKGYVLDAFLEYNYCHDNHGAAAFVNGNETNHFAGSGSTNVHFRYNVFTCSNSTGAIRIYDNSTGSDPKDLKIYGNVVYNSTISGGLYIGPEVEGALALLVYNNTFYNAPVVVNSSATITVFEFKNNIVYGTSGPANNLTQATATSNNLFTDPTFKNAASLPTGFTGTYGVDLAPNSDGLSVLAGSPAIDTGATLDNAYNGSINSVTRPSGAGWDIGAWEFVASVVVPPSNAHVVIKTP